MGTKSKESTEKSISKESTKNNRSDCPIPNGVLVMIGGKEDKGQEAPENKQAPENFTGVEILKTFVELIGKDDPVIEVITSASSLAEGSFQDYNNVFSELGVKRINHIHHFTRKEVLESDL